MLTSCQLGPKERIAVLLNRNTKVLIHENAFENVVCEMADIFVMHGINKRYGDVRWNISKAAHRYKRREAIDQLCLENNFILPFVIVK